LGAKIRFLPAWIRWALAIVLIKPHYYMTHTAINPTGIVPIGPELSLA
jgi:glutathionyl-hydroquinone reductase